MQLTPDTKGKRLDRERGLLGACLLLFGIGLVALFWRAPVASIPSTPERIACDAERVRGEHFYNGDFTFQGGNYQSRLMARSGNHSLALPSDGITHYGFTITLDHLQAGEVYEVFVWSFGNVSESGKLTIQGREPMGLYQESSQTIETDDAGWNLHKLRFHIPFQNTPQELSVYVYSNGSETIYFDDLLIKKVDLWQGSDFETRKLDLRIAPDAMQQLTQKRDEALRQGLLITNEEDWIAAEVQAHDAPLEARIRLKGDLLDHLRGDKWSYRVKLKGNGSWEGMRTFSLHTPAARYFLHEWLLHRWWKEQDVLHTRYDFVELTINGQSKGIYAYEEHFEKQLIESQQRREGPIVKFNEEGFWTSVARQLDHHGYVINKSGHTAQERDNAPITAFNENELLADTLQTQYYQEAQILLAQYRDGRMPAADIFDLDKLARFYAGCDLLNAYHGIVWHNQRFYYNPMLGKLEPIGFDGFADHPAARLHFLAEGALHPDKLESTTLPAILLQDSAFVRRYVNILQEESDPEQWQAFVKSQEAAWTARLSWLQLEFPDYQPDLSTFSQEVAFVRSHLLPFSATCFRSYQAENGQLKITNTHTLPLVLLGYGSTERSMSGRLLQPVWLPAGPLRQLRAKIKTAGFVSQFSELNYWNQQALAWQTTPYYSEVDIPSTAKYLYYQLPGWDTLLTAPLRITPSPAAMVSAQTFRTASLAEDFPSLRWNDQQQQVLIPAGKHELKKDLIIAPDYQLLIAAGAEINLSQRAAIISYGAVQAIGEEELPITIGSTDGSGQGLQVLQADKASVLYRVVFRGLRNLHKNSWQLTGAVTFLESAVQIEECLFTDNQSEDALNLVRSRFSMNNCAFQNISSDALDSDFCKGTISGCSFRNTVNDGLDFSGSVVTVKDGYFENCGDKGISVGEASDLTVIDTQIKGCPIALAAKDESTVHARRLSISDCSQGLVAFQKKPEYGPAYLIVEELEVENVDRLYQIGPGSRLQIDEEIIENQD